MFFFYPYFVYDCRAEKSEVLTEDVQSAEKHVEVLKLSCSTTARKICGLISCK